MSIVSLVIAPTLAKLHHDKIESNRKAKMEAMMLVAGGENVVINEMIVKTTDSSGVETTVINTTKGSVNEAGDFVYDLGAMGSLKLADGTELNVGGNSSEKKLFDFINDANRPVDKNTWFTLDRLYFETGKSTLKPESKEQLKNIAAMLKAYPALELKLGGYTDNTGDSLTNVKLSTNRAESAKAQLEQLGGDAKRISAEGYGPLFPVCAANDTKECKAQNRRIDVRVTKK
jgi:OmpA-OmpF porin, OOP family